jgi:hypothetical protein
MIGTKLPPGPQPGVTGMFSWPQIDDQRQRSLVTADAQIQTTNTSKAVYVLAANIPIYHHCVLHILSP